MGRDRREFLEAALGLAVLPMLRAASARAGTGQGNRDHAMTKHIVMIHGANEGAWCFDRFKAVFESLGFTCHAPDLVGHGTKAVAGGKNLVGVGMADYRAELEAFLATVPPRPVLLGHSMGGMLAQQLAARGLAGALVLAAPAPRAGILPPTEAEKKLDRDLIGLGAFWQTVIDPDFDLARIYTLNRVPESEQRAMFDKFGPESGRAFFELFFWMFDRTGATLVDTAAVRCPVLCLVGSDDKIVSPQTARETADAYAGAAFWQLDGHGHMLVLEAGAENIARRIADWIPG
jgi:pimeloyl-ACP methyl ester carboxylesterase